MSRIEEKEETLAWFRVNSERKTPFCPLTVENKTGIPLSLEVYVKGIKAQGFVQIQESHVVIAPSAITKIIVEIEMAKLSFWQKLKWIFNH